MIKTTKIIAVLAGVLLLNSCSSIRNAQSGPETDAVYFSSEDLKKEQEGQVYNNNNNQQYSQANPGRTDEFEAGRYDKYAGDNRQYSGDASEYYYDDDYYYSRQLRRYSSGSSGNFNYYDPWYSNNFYYTYGNSGWNSPYNNYWWYDPWNYNGPSYAWTYNWGNQGYNSCGNYGYNFGNYNYYYSPWSYNYNSSFSSCGCGYGNNGFGYNPYGYGNSYPYGSNWYDPYFGGGNVTGPAPVIGHRGNMSTINPAGHNVNEIDESERPIRPYQYPPGHSTLSEIKVRTTPVVSNNTLERNDQNINSGPGHTIYQSGSPTIVQPGSSKSNTDRNNQNGLNPIRNSNTQVEYAPERTRESEFNQNRDNYFNRPQQNNENRVRENQFNSPQENRQNYNPPMNQNYSRPQESHSNPNQGRSPGSSPSMRPR